MYSAKSLVLRPEMHPRCSKPLLSKYVWHSLLTFLCLSVGLYRNSQVSTTHYSLRCLKHTQSILPEQPCEMSFHFRMHVKAPVGVLCIDLLSASTCSELAPATHVEADWSACDAMMAR